MAVFLPPIVAASSLLAQIGWLEGMSVAAMGILVWRMWTTQAALKAELTEESRRLGEEQQKNTEGQHALESLLGENKAKSEMLSALSRDIRGHLNGIMGAADLLVDPTLKPRQREHLTTLRASAESLHQSLNDIVDYSAIETGQLQIAQAKFDLRQPLTDVIETVSPLALVKGLDLILIVAPNVPLEVTGDIARLRQILLNLTSNAVRFTSQGRVVLHVALDDGDMVAPAGSLGLHFSVSDTGPAIPENLLTTIFDRPSSSGPASPRSFGGAGLELAIVKRLVGLMGGKIGARNLPEGGSEFWIDLAVPAGREPTPPRIPGLHVVALDELAAGRIAVSAILTRLGIDHDATDTVPQAIEMLHDAMDAEATELVLLVDEAPAKLHNTRLARLLAADPSLKDMRAVLMSPDPEGVTTGVYDFPIVSVLRKPVLRPESLLDALLAAPSDAGPRISSSRAPFAPQLPTPAEATQPLVLVVDDDSISRSVSSQLLAILGCRVESVVSGQAAIDRARETAYSLIFMDCQMPELDGYETTRRLVAAGQGRLPPIVALTANTSAKDREKCFSSGMSDFVAKPVHKADLARILQRWARRETGAGQSSPPLSSPCSAVAFSKPPVSSPPGATLGRSSLASAAEAASRVTLPFANGARDLVAFPQKRPLIVLTSRPPQLETPFAVFNEGLITPNDAFFVRYHLSDIPTAIDPAAFRLRVHGKVNAPLDLSLEALKRLAPPVDLVAVNQCSGNSRGFFSPRVNGGQLGHGAMGCAKWTGIPLKAVLEKAGVAATARQVAFNGLDRGLTDATPDFIKALDVDHALEGEVMLAWAMNGEDLPMLNGYPLRLVVPGYFGTYWVKHLNDIEVLDSVYSGFWMTPAYRVPDNPSHSVEPGTTPKKTVPISRFTIRSFITSLGEGSTLPTGRETIVRGIAFDSGHGLREVTFSSDGGRTWRAAELGVDQGRYGFREWKIGFTPTQRGAHTLLARALNRIGETQPLDPLWNPAGYARNVVEPVHVEAA